jgi:two-component system chemotaxis sensor kinase CheA
MERQLRDLREGVMRVRMVPIGEVFERMRFVVRDLAREYQKNVKLEISGQHTEIDKLLVERMMDPILHLVRNAVSHGLESIGERAAKGKPAEGKLALRAFTEGEMVVIEIEDDGKGIDASDVATRARALGLIDPGAKLDPSMLLQLICEPGLSTREEADRASGRGIGMAVVKNTVLGLGGSFELDTEVGRGARFTIHLPFTLAIADALIVSVSGERFAVTQSSVAEVMEVESSAVKTFENNEIIPHRGGVLSLVRLARLFNLEETAGHSFQVFVIGKGASAVGIAVDRILGQREIVVRAINDPLIQVPGITGATELGDGRIVLIVDAAGLTRAARIPQ